jgi:electron transport complex protein RnfD
MEFPTDNVSSQVDNSKVAEQMRLVIYALFPGILVMIWLFGWGTIFNLILANFFALGMEATLLKLRKRPVKAFLSDYSAVVTATLLALALPAFSPWWIIFIAIFFAIVVAKHLYGGLGYNPFNPAMVGYAVVLVSFPVEMVNWFAPVNFSIAQIGLSDSLQIIFDSGSSQWDAMTMATPLDSIKIGLGMDKTIADIQQQKSFGLMAGSGWEWVSLAYFVGGIWLIYKKVISWHIPTTIIVTLALLSTIFWVYNPDTHTSPIFHLLTGGTMLGAFFIATDPITASTTPLGKIFYAASIAFFIYTIRVWGSGYPDGVAFSVLIMNIAVPLIDYYTQPKVFGESRFSRFNNDNKGSK